MTLDELRNGLEKHGEKYGNSRVFSSFLWDMMYPGRLATQEEAEEFDRLLVELQPQEPRIKVSYSVQHPACGNDVFESWAAEDAELVAEDFIDRECDRCCHLIGSVVIKKVFHWIKNP